ncbi:MAG: hypothetical protein ACRDN0_31995 [Trebonia sp.]
MNSSQEIQVARDLGELAAGQPFVPDIEAIGVRARQQHRRFAATRTETVAYATAKAKMALADVNRYVLRAHQVQTGPDGHLATIWADPRTGNNYEIAHDSSVGTSAAWLSTYLGNRSSLGRWTPENQRAPGHRPARAMGPCILDLRPMLTTAGAATYLINHTNGVIPMSP